ncbi:MAG: 16S rRNA (cytosine(967)-C(5))-methyltransferase RsmB [Verrucomicrobia bacterium]|nr:16S rRNA (cytosine(967)-C(5))-methyltransferase RsmB [Verrucomicrobiota bacterium]MDB4745652.1 16S rRNA (cytosine(967)-C(5))-methyltransferase RsmB [Verrucomicrobiota bacterium]
MAIEKPREIALRVIQKAFESDEILDRIMGDSLSNPKLEPRDRALIQELVFGVIRSRRLIDHLLSRLVERRPSANLQSALQLGLYQLLFLTRIPDYAVVDEMVNIVKRMAGVPQGRFVNAVLRRAVRDRESLVESIESLKETRPELAFSCPDWLFRRWEARLSPDDLRSLLEWQNQVPDIFGRLNRLKMNEDELESRAVTEGLKLVPMKLSWESTARMFRIENASGIAQRESFKMGGYYIQDPSTLLSVDVLDPQSGERVLDLCSAPGGKTAFVAEKMNNTGEIVACDAVGSRLELVEENAQRLGIDIVSRMLVNESALPERLIGSFDRVLADVPCSNTGVLRRRVDLRWRLRQSEIRLLSNRQLALLQRAASAVKPGGRLVYSTCSLEPEENGDVIERFLRDIPEFSLISERQLTPYEDSCDGAYVALLAKS